MCDLFIVICEDLLEEIHEEPTNSYYNADIWTYVFKKSCFSSTYLQNPNAIYELNSV